MKIPAKYSSIFFSIALAFPVFASNTELSCSHEESVGGKAKKGASLELVINENGGIEELGTSSFYMSGEEGGGYFCGLGFPDPEHHVDVTFEQTSDATVIFVNYEDIGKSELRLVKTATGYKLDFTSPNFLLCGAQAEFPKSIEITTKSKKCKVTWPPSYAPKR